jgi:hypothetical protein
MQAVASRWSHARRTYCAAATLFVTLSSTACHAWRTEGVSPKAVLATRQQVTLRVTRIDGSQVVLERPVLQGDILLGDTLPGTRPDTSVLRDVRIPLTDVREVATRGFSAGRTVGLGLGVAAGLAAAWGVFVAIFLATCANCH